MTPARPSGRARRRARPAATPVGSLFEEFERKVGEGALDLRGTVLALSHVPYGRPSRPTAEQVVVEWRGTCSTKHLLFQALVAERWPAYPTAIWHRVYRVTRGLAQERGWGPSVAEAVPTDGLVDVHTFAVLRIGRRDVRIDVTFPLADWDGRPDVPLACGEGEDVPGGDDPLATKARLVQNRCDPAVRERFLSALATRSPDATAPDLGLVRGLDIKST